MKVINASNDHFEALSKRIEKNVNKSESILVIGVASGGLPIMTFVFDYLKERNYSVDKSIVTTKRPSTKVKKNTSIFSSFFEFLLPRLPYSITDYLRVCEHLKLSKRKGCNQRDVTFEQSGIESFYDVVLIIDDAVDSGHSLLEVKNEVSKLIVCREIITSSLVVTQSNPVLVPDIFLLDNVLVRFPWSLDAKK